MWENLYLSGKQFFGQMMICCSSPEHQAQQLALKGLER